MKMTPRRAGFLVVFVILGLYFWKNSFFHHIEAKLYDWRLQVRSHQPENPQVFIADIDEQSLQEFGRWPWSRKVIAQMVDRLREANVKAIGFDMVFSEEIKTDLTSNIDALQEKWQRQRPNLEQITDPKLRKEFSAYEAQTARFFSEIYKTKPPETKRLPMPLTKRPTRF